MNLFGRIAHAWAALAGRASARAEGWGPTGGPGYSDAWRTRRGPTPQRLVEAYRQVVYACASINASGVARVPLRLYATTGRGSPKPRSFAGPVEARRDVRRRLASVPYLARQMAAAETVDEITSHPLLDALAEPNPEFDLHSMLAYLVLCLDVVGSAYLRTEGAAGLPPEHLWPLQAHLVRPVPGASAIARRYTYAGETIEAADLIRFRHVSLREPYGPGYAPAEAAFAYAGLEAMWVSIQEQILGRGPAPTMLVSAADPKMPIGKESRARYEADLNRRLTGAAGGGAMFVDEAVHVAPLTYRPTDLSGLEISKYDLERTANCFAVPLPFLTGDTNLANLQAAELQHGRHAIEPRCCLIAAVLTRWARAFDPRLCFAFDSAVAEDEEREAKVWDVRVKNGTATINEARAEDGYEPVPWGHEPWLASTLRQPSEERPEPKPIAPPQPPDPKPAEGDEKPEPEDEPADDAEKALLADVASILTVVRGRLDDKSGVGGTGAGGGRPGADHTRRASEGRGAREHLRAAGWRGDQADVEEVVQGAGEGDLGDDRGDRGPAA